MPEDVEAISVVACSKQAYTVPQLVCGERLSMVSVFACPGNETFMYPSPDEALFLSMALPSTSMRSSSPFLEVSAPMLPSRKAYTASTVFTGLSHACVRFSLSSQRLISSTVWLSSGVTWRKASMAATSVGMR